MAKEKTISAKDVLPDDALNQKLDRLAEAGMERTKEWVTLWQESLRYFFSDQLHGKRTHKDWDWVVVNYIWPTAIQEIAKLSKNPPRIICSPWEETDAEAAEVWQSKLQWDWEQGINGTGMRLEQIAAILDGKIFGYRISKIFWEENCYWDDQTKQWVGDVKHKLWHPAYFWADPNADTLQDAQAVGTERWVTLEWAQQRWPKYKAELADLANTYKDEYKGGWGGDTVRGQLAGGEATSGYGGTDSGIEKYRASRLLSLIEESDKMSNADPSKTQEPMVKITETYFRDYETINQRQEADVPAENLAAEGKLLVIAGAYFDPQTGKAIEPNQWPKELIREWKEPKYPNGRVVIRCFDKILNPDYKDQRYPYRQWPFVVVPHYLLPHMWQGIDAVQMYKTTQDMINVTASHLVNYMKMYGDPKVLIEDGALATNPRTKQHYKVGAGAGSIIRLVRGAITGQRFKFQDPPAISPATMMLYQLFAQEFKNITGMQSVAMGEKEPGEMSATQSAHLAISSNDRIALQSAYEDQWVRRCCRLIAEICQEKYDIGRFVRIVGEDRVIGAKQITDRLKLFRYDINVEPAANLPFDIEKKQARYLQAYQLLQSPVPNAMLPETLRVLEIGEWKKIIQRYEAWTMFAAFQQLYEQVKAGKMDPQQARTIIEQKLIGLYQSEAKQGQLPQAGENKPAKATPAK